MVPRLVSGDTFNQPIAQPLMISFTMVVGHEFCDGPSEMPFTERYHPANANAVEGRALQEDSGVLLALGGPANREDASTS